MPKFDEVLGGFTPDVELPDDWRDQLTNAYNEDFQGASAAVENVTSEYNAYKTSSTAEIKNLKAVNFDLLRKQPSAENNNDSNDSEDKHITIDDLFGEKK